MVSNRTVHHITCSFSALWTFFLSSKLEYPRQTKAEVWKHRMSFGHFFTLNILSRCSETMREDQFGRWLCPLQSVIRISTNLIEGQVKEDKSRLFEILWTKTQSVVIIFWVWYPKKTEFIYFYLYFWQILYAWNQ